MHYVELRRHDLRALQDRLAAVGLSSLGRAESCVAATLNGVFALVSRSCGIPPRVQPDGLMTLETSRRRLVHGTEQLLGRSRKRRFHVVEASAAGALVESQQTAYIATGTRLHHALGDCVIGELPPVDQPLVLRPGDTLLVTRDASGCAGPPARIPCTLPQVFADVRAGDRNGSPSCRRRSCGSARPPTCR